MYSCIDGGLLISCRNLSTLFYGLDLALCLRRFPSRLRAVARHAYLQADGSVSFKGDEFKNIDAAADRENGTGNEDVANISKSEMEAALIMFAYYCVILSSMYCNVSQLACVHPCSKKPSTRDLWPAY